MNTGTSGASVSRLSPCGTFISSTMMVMMIARTPSLNASSLLLPISPSISADVRGLNRRSILTKRRGFHRRRPESGAVRFEILRQYHLRLKPEPDLKLNRLLH